MRFFYVIYGKPLGHMGNFVIRCDILFGNQNQIDNYVSLNEQFECSFTVKSIPLMNSEI